MGGKNKIQGLYEPENSLDPGDNLVTGWVGRLVEIDHSRANVGLDVALQWGASIGNWGEVSRPHENCDSELETRRLPHDSIALQRLLLQTPKKNTANSRLS